MSSSRPYLLRALYEWIVDNGATPQILVDASAEGLQVPDNVLSGSKLVLNISPGAVRDLDMDNEYVSFVARFSGVSQGVIVPVDAVLAVYARENGQGMMFPESDHPDERDDAPSADGAGPRPVSGPSRANRNTDDGHPEDSPEDDPEGRGTERKGRPNLKVIK
jgi:stringent starvation protein B